MTYKQATTAIQQGHPLNPLQQFPTWISSPNWEGGCTKVVYGSGMIVFDKAQKESRIQILLQPCT